MLCGDHRLYIKNTVETNLNICKEAEEATRKWSVSSLQAAPMDFYVCWCKCIVRWTGLRQTIVTVVQRFMKETARWSSMFERRAREQTREEPVAKAVVSSRAALHARGSYSSRPAGCFVADRRWVRNMLFLSITSLPPSSQITTTVFELK